MATQKAYYDVVRDWLDVNIRSGTLPPGMRLTVAAVSDRLSVSRSPVKRALDLLEGDGALTRDGGSGYVVPGAMAGEAETANLHTLSLNMPVEGPTTLVRASWERILHDVEQAVMNCIPFGIYQISESGICAYFGVSRTVTREVLARLHDRRVITKDRASHWIAGPLSARLLDEAHEVRRLLEPAALSVAAASLDRTQTTAMILTVETALATRAILTPDRIDGIETDLHDTCIAPLRNRRMAEAVARLQLGRVVNRLFATYIGQHDDTEMLTEHRLVLGHLMIGDGPGAGMALAHHLDADHRRTRDRLKVLSVFSEPDIAPYLDRMV